MAEQLANNAASTLNGAVDNVVTSWTVANGSVFPATGNFRVICDNEIGLCTARAGNVLTVTRGVETTVAASHSNGAAVTHVLTQAGLSQYITDRLPAVPSELDYVEKTSNTSITATTEATANTIVTANPITFDGSTVIFVEFFAPIVRTPATNVACLVVLYDGTSIGLLTQGLSSAGTMDASLSARRRLTPSAASHTYSARAYVPSGTGTVFGGGGGAGGFMPAFIRIIKA